MSKTTDRRLYTVRLRPEFVAQIDRVRGTQSREAWIRDALTEALESALQSQK